MIKRFFIIVCALFGAGLFSQAPEFAQQYRATLQGAVTELQQIAQDFDSAIARAGLTREQALAHYRVPENGFLADRGRQISGTLLRYQILQEQQQALEAAGPLARVWLVARRPDSAIIASARERFEPAIPLTTAGLVMIAVGLLVGWFAARLILASGRASAVRKLAPGPRAVEI